MQLGRLDETKGKKKYVPGTKKFDDAVAKGTRLENG